MINFICKQFSRSLTFGLTLKESSFEPMPISTAVCIVMPQMLVTVTSVGAGNKFFGLSGFSPLHTIKTC